MNPCYQVYALEDTRNLLLQLPRSSKTLDTLTEKECQAKWSRPLTARHDSCLASQTKTRAGAGFKLADPSEIFIPLPEVLRLNPNHRAAKSSHHSADHVGCLFYISMSPGAYLVSHSYLYYRGCVRIL